MLPNLLGYICFELIISLKNSGFSAKKIQYDLKRTYNYVISQQNIRNMN